MGGGGGGGARGKRRRFFGDSVRDEVSAKNWHWVVVVARRRDKKAECQDPED